jgi:hypothetical protein
MTIVFMPEARKPLICEAVKPLAFPMPPAQKIIAVAAVVRCGLAIIWISTNAKPASHDIFRCIIYVLAGLKFYSPK